MDVKDYLDRIGIQDIPLPTVENLHRINQAHFKHIPFENLDLHLGVEVTLEVEKCWEKLVLKRRGGWCHEHITVIDTALKLLGYNVQPGTGQVFVTPTVISPPGSHAFAIVSFDRREQHLEQYLIDVGFPDTTLEALNISDSILDQPQTTSNGRVFKITKEGSDYYRWTQDKSSKDFVRSWYWNSSAPDLNAHLFASGNTWVQCDPTSPFLKNVLVSMIGRDGYSRITLSGANKIVTSPTGEKTRQAITQEEFVLSLKEDFGIDFPSLFAANNTFNPSPLEGMFQ